MVRSAAPPRVSNHGYTYSIKINSRELARRYGGRSRAAIQASAR